jgi:hypothetical protein
LATAVNTTPTIGDIANSYHHIEVTFSKILKSGLQISIFGMNIAYYANTSKVLLIGHT